ncbi:MAG: anti-sigma factor family protein [bacterium]
MEDDRFDAVMKVCKFRDKIIDYIEGLLDEPQKAIFENHIKRCDACQKELSEMERFYEIMDKDTIPILEEVVFAHIKQRARQEEIVLRKPRWKIWNIFVPVLGALVFILLLSIHKEQILEISVPISTLLQDQDFSALLLERIVDNNMVSQFNSLEEFFYADIEQGLRELTVDESKQFIEIMNEKYGEKYL